MQQHHVQANAIPYEYVLIRIARVFLFLLDHSLLYFLFVRLQVLLFVYVRRHFIFCTLFDGILKYSAAPEQEASLKKANS